MVEYSFDEAKTLLKTNLENAKSNLERFVIIFAFYLLIYFRIKIFRF